MELHITVITNIVTQRNVTANLKNKKIYIASRTANAANKNVLLAIEAFDAIAHKYPDWSLDIYTNIQRFPNDDYVKLVSNFLENCQSKEQINILESNKELEETIPEYSIYLNPSFSEGMSNSLCEAMSFGVPPVVLKECISNSDIVDDGINGLTTGNDAQSYSKDIEKLIQDENLREKLGLNSKEKMKGFSEEKVIDKWIDFIKDNTPDSKETLVNKIYPIILKLGKLIKNKLLVISYHYDGVTEIRTKIFKLHFVIKRITVLLVQHTSRDILAFHKYLFFDSHLRLVILNIEVFKFIKHLRHRTLFCLKKRLFLTKNSHRHDFAIDKKYITLLYGNIFQTTFDLTRPMLFTEKLNSLKMVYRDKYHTNLVDKVQFKEIMKKKIGEKYVVPTLGVYKTVKEFKRDVKNLPEEFIVKCNHVSGSVFYISKHSQVNHEMYHVLNSTLQVNYYSFRPKPTISEELRHIEFYYKNIETRIIVEPAINIKNRQKDFQIFASFGEVMFSRTIYDDHMGIELKKFEHVAFDRHKQVITDDLPLLYQNSTRELDFPEKHYPKMLEITKKISHDLPFARIDFLLDNDRFYVIEVTLIPGAGLYKAPYHINLKYGQMIGDFSHLMPKI